MIETLPEILRRRAEQAGDAVFLEEVGGQAFSNAEYYRQSLRFADALSRAGVGRGDFVAAMLEPSGESYLVWLGAAWLGAVQVPFNTDFRGATLAHVLNSSGARVLVTTAAMVERVARIAGELRAIETIVLVDDGEAEWRGNVLRLADLLDGAQPIEREAPREFDPYAVIFTSGTTGLSKGVVTSWLMGQRAVHSQFPGERPGDNPDGACYTPWPTFHGTGPGGLLVAGELGLRTVVRPKFSVSAFWDDVRKYRCTHVNMIGFGALLLNQPARPDDADNPLKRALMLPVPTRYREFESRFGAKVSTIWGMTEIGLPVASADPKNSACAGQLLPDYEARLVDENDYEVPEGEPGQFIIRSHRPWLLMTEYLGQPAATAKSWRNGWFHTGDILRRDADGEYYFVDRAADYIRRRGHNISSLEVEAAVTAHPQVQACACIGVPSALAEMDDGAAGEGAAGGAARAEVARDLDVKIVVERIPGAEVSEAELFAYLIDNMPRFMLPRYVEFVAEMPRTPTMKVRKSELRGQTLSAATWDREAAGVVV